MLLMKQILEKNHRGHGPKARYSLGLELALNSATAFNEMCT